MPHKGQSQFQLGLLIFPSRSGLLQVLEPSHVVRPHCCSSVVLPILHEFLKVVQHPGLDLLCFSGHHCKVAIHKTHGIQLVIDVWLV